MTEDHLSNFCIPSVKSINKKIDLPAVENFDFFESLESIYPLLEIVFSFLSYNDLKAAAKVKLSWKQIADKVLRKRMKPSWITCYKRNHLANMINYSENLNYNNVNIGIILYDSRRIKLNKYICLHTNTSELSRKTVIEFLSDEVIPRSVDYCLISCPKVNSYFDSRKEVTTSSIFDGVFIPEIPNIRTTMFHCTPSKKQGIAQTIEPYIKSNEQVKCLLLFSMTALHKSIFNLLDLLIPENKAHTVAVGGGIIRGTKTFQQVNPQKKIYSNKDAFCIAFLQDKFISSDFDAFSYVINGDDLSKKEFEYELQKFYNQIELRTHSVGFRICCSAKMDSECELVIFNKLFPQTPLLGMDVEGEIGWNCLNRNDDEDCGESNAKRAKRKYPTVHHQWSTIFVLVTWGQVVNKKS